MDARLVRTIAILALAPWLILGCATHSWQKPAHVWRTAEALDLGTVEETLDATGRWRWPLDEVHVTSPFGRRGRRFHYGVDLRARVGTPIRAVADGRVIFVGDRVGGFGKLVVVEHGPALFSLYAHSSKYLVKAGGKVRKGDTIALSGRSGRVKGPHLHFEVRQGAMAKSVNPSLVLPPVRRWASR